MRRQRVRQILLLLALLCFVGGGASWFIKEPDRLGLMAAMSVREIHRPAVSPWEQIPEADAPVYLERIQRERERLLTAGKMDVYTNHKLVRDLFDLQERIVYQAETKSIDYDLYVETAPPFYRKIDAVWSSLREDLKACCDSPETLQIESQLWDKDRENHLLREFRPVETKEHGAINRYKSERMLFWFFLGTIPLVMWRGLQTGWTFERLVGRKLIRFATLSAAITFSMAGGPAMAFQILAQVKKTEQTLEKVEKKDSTDPLKNGRHKFADKLTVWLWGDLDHDDQQIDQFVHHSGATGQLQLRRAMNAGKPIGGNFTAGWTFRTKPVDLTITAGPAFNVAVKGQKLGLNSQYASFIIGSWRTRYIWFSGLAKLMFSTDGKTSFGSRHVETFRGPPERTPRILRGIALQAENWRVYGPDKTSPKPHWNELMIGPAFNVGEIVGKPKGWLSWFTVYPYKDFCRPLPSHTRTWDVRLQFKRTFALSH